MGQSVCHHLLQLDSIYKVVMLKMKYDQNVTFSEAHTLTSFQYLYFLWFWNLLDIIGTYYISFWEHPSILLHPDFIMCICMCNVYLYVYLYVHWIVTTQSFFSSFLFHRTRRFCPLLNHIHALQIINNHIHSI